MADFSITEALGVGTGLIARKPLAVLAWGVLPVVVFVPLLLLFAGTLIGIVAAASRAGADQSAIAASIMPAIGGLFLFVLLAIVLAWVVSAMISGAAYRAVLHPEQSGFAYLRFGSQELWLMAVAFVMGLVFFGIGLALAIPQAIVNLAMLNSGVGARVAAVVLFTLVREAITIWIWLRLSMALPMTFAQSKFQLFEVLGHDARPHAAAARLWRARHRHPDRGQYRRALRGRRGHVRPRRRRDRGRAGEPRGLLRQPAGGDRRSRTGDRALGGASGHHQRRVDGDFPRPFRSHLSPPGRRGPRRSVHLITTGALYKPHAAWDLP